MWQRILQRSNTEGDDVNKPCVSAFGEIQKIRVYLNILRFTLQKRALGLRPAEVLAVLFGMTTREVLNSKIIQNK